MRHTLLVCQPLMLSSGLCKADQVVQFASCSFQKLLVVYTLLGLADGD
jgi:hypothetical protein